MQCAAGMVTDAFADFVVGHGELWCAQLMAATIASLGVPAAFMDTREVCEKPTMTPVYKLCSSEYCHIVFEEISCYIYFLLMP